MCNYSFVSIFAFILAFYVSVGNATIECYQCVSYSTDPHPDCINVNRRTPTVKHSAASSHERCVYQWIPFEDGTYYLERSSQDVHQAEHICRSAQQKYPGSKCNICARNFCNS